jgi:uncharacterized protein YlxP (DUF503 family)
MFAALVTAELHIPAATSLKGKRSVVKALTMALRNSLNVSVAEVDHQDLWQRCTLGVAAAAGSEGGARQVAQSVEKILYREPRVELIRFDVEVAGTEG